MRLAEGPYRARQLFQALFPRLGPGEIAQASSILGPGEMQLFLGMEKRDQCHGLRVLHQLTNEGHADRELLAAALLHDCGKGHVPVALRVLYVLAPWAIEAAARQAKDAAAPGLRDTCYRLVHHAEIGAELARAAGAGEATVRLIAGRAAEHERDKISVLRAADDRS